jgi:hypothetical protein
MRRCSSAVSSLTSWRTSVDARPGVGSSRVCPGRQVRIGFAQLQPEHFHDDANRAGRADQQQVRARHARDLQILVGFARETPLFSDL